MFRKVVPEGSLPCLDCLTSTRVGGADIVLEFHPLDDAHELRKSSILTTLKNSSADEAIS